MFELMRRLLISEGFKEISFNQITEKYEYLNKDYFGAELLKYEYAESYINKIKKENYDFAEKKLSSIVNRTETYEFLKNCDVDVKFNLNNFKINQYISDTDKVAIIYMHNVSDAQYFFGLDEFIDLHDWLMKSIKILTSHNIKVVIKAHPSFHGSHGLYPVDIKYLDFLSKLFDLNLWDLDKNSLNKTNIEDVYFIYYKVSSKALSNMFKNHLCITHHGKVTLELAYLGHDIILSTASPYFKEDYFVYRYDNLNEYEQLIVKWKEKKLLSINKEDKMKSLFRYIWIQQICIKPHIYNELISKFNQEDKVEDIENYIVTKDIF